MYPSTNAIRWWYESLDRLRRQRGLELERLGLGPEEAPYRTVLTHAGMRLRRYGDDAARPVALIVPAPIKRPYIWDLSPDHSVVRAALARGMQVYLIEWSDPSGADGGPGNGLEDYGHALIERCIEAIASSAGSAGQPVFLLAHSLGGVFAAIYAGLRPDRVAGLVTVEAPLHFGEASGSFGPLLAFGPRAAEITRWFDTVPGSVLGQASITASPTSFQVERYADLIRSLGCTEELEGHWKVQRWTLDEAPMSRRLFEQVVEHLYREDRFMRGRLHVHGKDIGPSSITAPFLAVYDPRSLIIPPASIIDFHRATASKEKRLLAYHGDTGIALAHVGALVGRNAHSQLWPDIFDWIAANGARLRR